MALAGVDTDRERIDAWNAENAIAANKVVAEFGIQRKGLIEEDLIGYNPTFLDGLWLRAPYMHNGSVPTLRDLPEPPAQRRAEGLRVGQECVSTGRSRGSPEQKKNKTKRHAV